MFQIRASILLQENTSHSEKLLHHRGGPDGVPPGEEAGAQPRVEEAVGVALLHVDSVVQDGLTESKQPT